QLHELEQLLVEPRARQVLLEPAQGVARVGRGLERNAQAAHDRASESRAYRSAPLGAAARGGCRGSGIGAAARSASGITPAQCASCRSSSSSIGPPARVLTDTSSSGKANTRVALSSLGFAGRV